MNKDLISTSEKFKVLGGDIRLEIVKFLTSGEKCVCNIFKHLNLPQNLISHHLGVLRKSTIIVARKEGKWVYYSLNKKTIEELKNMLENTLLSKKKKSRC